MNGVVYCITNAVNGKQYVGITTQTMEQRFKFHLRATGGCRRLQAAIRHHGASAFNVSEIDRGTTEDELSAKERIWIDRLGTIHPAGYNLSRGGASNMIVHDETRALQARSAERKWQSKAAREKASDQMKRAWATDPALVASHTWSDEARAKRAATFADPEWKARKSASSKEVFSRPTVRAAISAARRESWKDPMYAKAALAGLRKPETLAKRTATRSSPEWRALQSEKTRAAMARPEVQEKMRLAMERRKTKSATKGNSNHGT